MRELDDLEQRLRRIGDALDCIIKGDPLKQDALKDVFRLNHEVGRIARESPSLSISLREMQLEVNFMTIHIKRNEPEMAKERLQRVISHLDKVRAAPSSASKDQHRPLTRDL